MPFIQIHKPDVRVNFADTASRIYVSDTMEFISETGSVAEYLLYETQVTIPADNVLRIQKCWFSTTPDPTAASYRDITKNGCPMNGVKFLSNGQSDTVGFSVYTTDWVDVNDIDANNVLIVHCYLDVCDNSGNNCDRNC